MKGTKAIVAIAVAALGLRLVLLFARGDYIVYDEGYYLLLARSLRAGHGFTLNGLPHVALSPLQPLIVAGLSLLGMNDLWASRLLAAVCGALLVFPVAALARRWFADGGAIVAALLTAVFPSLLTFAPFFPGRLWNLYFGSEPLFLLLGTSAIAFAAWAAKDGSWWTWVAAGACASLAYLTRLEGIVLAAALVLVAVVSLVRRPETRRWQAVLAPVAGLLIALPYLFYLHGALGRWALSGRVQAAASTEEAPVSAPASAAHGGSDVVNSFVWRGDQRALWQTLYALDGSGTRMASQYWGVPPRHSVAAAVPRPADSLPSSFVPDTLGSEAQTTQGATLFRGIALVVPPWLLVIAFVGMLVSFVTVRPRAEVALWLSPALLTAILPALLAYTEPRALLMLVPAVCVLAGGVLWWVGMFLAHARSARFGWLPIELVLVLALIAPARAIVGSWNQLTPLQRVATARRVVGDYLRERIPPGTKVVSWHPAIALYAHADWRVLPYDSFERIVGYARAQGAPVIVFSRFDPSPLNNPPRAFTIVLLDTASTATGSSIRLDPVDQTPLIFVGKLAASP